MKEIEIKFRVKNFKGILSNLKRLGACLEWSGREENFYFDTRAMRLKKLGGALRLRRWPGHSERLTLKTPSPTKRYKVRNEYQIDISNLKTMRTILENLGFYNSLHYFKKRSHWKLEGAAVELDVLRNEYFVEIEGPKKKIDKIAKELGLDWKNSTTKSYPKILTEKQK